MNQLLVNVYKDTNETPIKPGFHWWFSKVNTASPMYENIKLSAKKLSRENIWNKDNATNFQWCTFTYFKKIVCQSERWRVNGVCKTKWDYGYTHIYITHTLYILYICEIFSIAL